MTNEDGHYIKINILNDDMNYWFIRTNGGNWYNEFVAENHCTIVDPNINLKKLNELKTYDEMHKELTSLNELKIKKIEEYASKKNLSESEKDELIKDNTLSKRSITIETSRIYNFVHGIKVNDLIMMPYKSSRKYKIGYVISEAKEYTNEDLYSIENRSYIYDNKRRVRKYQVSKNKLYRDVQWITTIERKNVDAEILNHLNMHQAIANLDQFKFQLNHMIAPIYIQNNKLHINIKVNREEGIDNDLWLEFHEVLSEVEKVCNDKIDEIKVDVQSPGYIELICFIDPETLKNTFDGIKSTISNPNYGAITTGIIIFSIFNGKRITKIAGVEFEDKVPKKVKKQRDEEAEVQSRVNTKKLLLEEKKLDKEIEEIDTRNIQEKLETSIEDDSRIEDE
ncbi:hypothetical protein ACMGE6_07735 [Macrococcus equi]|uniref:hypothetical protein n=1 Tax=Macrococcus equi TaxID=3395462 RepID=UPI0039BDF734